jgi:exopolysaccharide production protein ExoZ
VRGLAALSVVIFHLGPMDFHPSWFRVIPLYGETGVQFFFVLSGFIISISSYKYFKNPSYLNSITFLIKRLIRVYPPFFASLIFSVIVNFVLDNHLITFKDFTLTASLNYIYLGGIPPQVVYWTLVHEMQFYFFISLTLLPMFTKYRNYFIYLFGISSFLIISKLLSNPIVNGNLFRHFHSFYFGIFIFELYRIKIIQNSQPKFVRGFIIQFIVLSVVSIIFLNHRLVASLIATILIATLVLIDPKVNKLNPLLFLGKISYSLYLIHIPIIKIFSSIFNVDVIKNSGEWFFSIGFTIFMAYIFYLFFEKPFVVKSQSLNKIPILHH